MNTVLHYVSVTGSYMFLYGLLYLILRYTVGQIPIIKNTTVWGKPLEIPLFSVIVLLLIIGFFEVSSPYVK